MTTPIAQRNAAQAAVEEYEARVKRYQIDRYKRVMEIVGEAVENDDPIILTRVLRNALDC